MHEVILKNIQRHIEPTTEDMEILLLLMVLKTVKRKELLLKEGDIARHQFFVISGCLRTYTIDSAGKEHVLMFAPEDWWCSGDLFSFLSGQQSVNNLEALEPTTFLQISKENLDTFYQRAPAFERFFRVLFQNAFVFHQNRINAKFCSTWPNQREITVKGKHFLQEDSPMEIGIAIAEFVKKLRK